MAFPGLYPLAIDIGQPRTVQASLVWRQFPSLGRVFLLDSIRFDFSS